MGILSSLWSAVLSFPLARSFLFVPCSALLYSTRFLRAGCRATVGRRGKWRGRLMVTVTVVAAMRQIRSGQDEALRRRPVGRRPWFVSTGILSRNRHVGKWRRRQQQHVLRRCGIVGDKG
ncbi:hypothetical protein F5B18DRAFT_595881 [Nemania serpens]|nr:hypothetical protein F5B18DRAFT_595881 [Nemania serpens]